MGSGHSSTPPEGVRESDADGPLGAASATTQHEAQFADFAGAELAPGTLLGEYQIEQTIGAGAMGVVYAAVHPRIGKRAAIKVLRHELCRDAVQVRRFIDEARVVNEIGDPSIVDVFAFGEMPDGRCYFVMEWLKGQSLQQRMGQGPLALTEIAAIVPALARALEAAHDKGVIHRDVKPDNIFLVEGRGGELGVKLLDFGIAKLTRASATPHQTAIGAMVGTPLYIAPEQANGVAIDATVDTYALGGILFHLLTGQIPFPAPSSMEMVARHMLDEPPRVSALRPDVPPALDGLVAAMLAKAPGDRPALAAVCAAFGAPASASWPAPMRPPTGAPDLTAVPAATPSAPARRGPRPLAVILVGVAVAAVAGGTFVLVRQTTAGGPAPLAPPHVEHATQLTHEADLQLDPAISPDGTRLAFASGQLGRMKIFVRPLAGGAATPIAPELSGNHRWPRWSPDGAQIAFQSDDGGYNSPFRIDVAPATGGPARPLVAPAGRSVAMPVWSPDGRELAYIQFDARWQPPWELVVARADGTAPRTVITFDSHDSLSTPSWSPDGSHLAFSRGNINFFLRGNLAPASLWVVAAHGDPQPVQTTPGTALDHAPVWTPDGRALWFVSDRDGSRDVYRLEVTPDGHAVGAPARLTVGLSAHSLAVAGDHRLVCAVFSYRTNLWAVDVPPDGEEASLEHARPVTTGTQIIEGVDVSPDGRWIAYDSNLQGNQDIYVMPAAGGDAVAVTTDPANDFAPAWSPDGARLAFHSFRTGSRNVFVMDRDGAHVAPVTSGSANHWSPRWAPDGQTLALFSDRGGDLDVYTVPATGGEPRRITRQRGSWPAWSPDGATLAFNDPRGLWTVPASGGAPTQLVAADRVANQVWARDGHVIYFRERDAAGLDAIWAVAPTGGPPRRVLRLDDPARHADRVELGVDRSRFLLPLTEHDADLWQLDLER